MLQSWSAICRSILVVAVAMTGGDQEELSPWSLARHSLRSRFFFIDGSVDKGESQSQLAGDRAAWLVRHMKDDDLRAVNAYLNSIPPVRNAVPKPIREPKKPQRRPHFLHEPCGFSEGWGWPSSQAKRGAAVFHLARRPTCHLLWRKAPRCDQPDFGLIRRPPSGRGRSAPRGCRP